MTKPAQPAAEKPWIEIFRAGTHTDSSGKKITFTQAHLDEIVASYDPANHEAPVVVGHPKTDDPALGWISGLKRDGDSLYASERDVHPEFAQMREQGLYRKRSASFYLRNSPGNPTPGKMHLRHVGNLGAMPPAVKAMADKAKTAAFNEDDGEGVIEFNDMVVDFGDGDAPRWIAGPIAQAFAGIRDNLIEALGVEKADRILPRYQIDSIREAGLIPESATRPLGYGEGEEDDITHPNEQPNPEEEAAMSQQAQDLAAAQAKLDDDRAELDRQQAEFNESKRVADEAAAKQRDEEQLQEATDFADGLVNEGKLLPANKAGVVALYQAAQRIEAPLNFGEGDDAQEKAAIEVVRETFSALPPAIDFSEKAGDKRADEPANFSAPPGSAVDADRLAIDAKARAHQKANPGTTYQQAVKAVGG